jgi:hypothetical protein
MKENMKDTIRIDAKNVDREVGEAFKSYVFKKHGKIRGVFSGEVTKALAMYLQQGEIDTKLVSLDQGNQITSIVQRLIDLEKKVFRPRDE